MPEIRPERLHAGVGRPWAARGMAVYLVGAGFGMDAGIPDSCTLLSEVHTAFGVGQRWARYAAQYDSVHNSIFERAPGLAVSDANIEHLVDRLRNPSRFVNASSADIAVVHDIVMGHIGRRLQVVRRSDLMYFAALKRLARVMPRPIWVVSLNFDLCIELLAGPGFVLETGFPGFGDGNFWDEGRFEKAVDADLCLLKPHGSLNWRRNRDGRLFSVEPREFQDIRESVIALGNEPKAAGEFPEPHDFAIAEFNRRAIEAGRVGVIGYGFRDLAVNKVLLELISRRDFSRLFVVTKFRDPGHRESEVARISGLIGGGEKVVFCDIGAGALAGSFEQHLHRLLE